MQTMTKANKVPMFVNSARTLSGMSAPMSPTAIPVKTVDFPGRAKTLVNRTEEAGRQKTVARHRQHDARLAEHQHHQDRSNSGQRAQRYEKCAQGSPTRLKACASGASMSILS